MSMDLYVLPPARITSTEARIAMEAVCARCDGVSFAPDPGERFAGVISFWDERILDIDLVEPGSGQELPDEEIPDEVYASRGVPQLLVSGRVSAWSWLEFAAVELAREVGGAIFDPQQGLTRPLEAAVDLASLRESTNELSARRKAARAGER